MRMQTNILIGIASALVGISAVISHTTDSVEPQRASQASQSAARGDQFVFALFHEGGDAAKLIMWQTLEATLAKRPGQARAVNIYVHEPAMKTVVNRYGVGRSSLPLVLAIAPNGAVTGAFAIELTEQDIAGAFVSPSQAACMKEEQTRQFVSLLVAPWTALWPTDSIWYWLTNCPANSNPTVVSRCCRCFKESPAREEPSLLADHGLHLTDYSLLTENRSCLDENLLKPCHWPERTRTHRPDTVRFERGAN